MNIELRDGLLFVSLTLSHEGFYETISDLVLDTGAAQSIIDMSAIQTLDVSSKDEDEFVFMSGIGEGIRVEKANRQRSIRLLSHGKCVLGFCLSCIVDP